MSPLNLPLLLIVLSVSVSCGETAPMDRLKSYDAPDWTKGWISLQTRHTLFRPVNEIPQLDNSRHKGHQLQKRKCNTATCVTQRLADFLVRSNNNIGTIYSPTNVGSYTYGKRDLSGGS
ncbi:islet amyloid polypeptide [Xenopus laevis]|uniref:Islet amyloid polypeptide n=2 Tax=Xenopus laevis TaxID=8355 RepID=A0A1L8GQE1_XENLA|nr:islet amyloid polypeptide [Xenopus laevis]XP_041443732.1 islet amyloid polypeptide [Xenopus laevis]OCT86006.1 hypothetical protein XELAEV_18019700mg [Xenopus laevis]